MSNPIVGLAYVAWLNGGNLSRAYLSGAYLSGADLSGAYLSVTSEYDL